MDKIKDDWGIIQTPAFLFQLPLLALSVAITHRFWAGAALLLTRV